MVFSRTSRSNHFIGTLVFLRASGQTRSPQQQKKDAFYGNPFHAYEPRHNHLTGESAISLHAIDQLRGLGDDDITSEF